jgi:hypothetical protein
VSPWVTGPAEVGAEGVAGAGVDVVEPVVVAKNRGGRREHTRQTNLLPPSQGDRLDHGRQRRASQKLSPKLLKLQTQTSEELMESKNTVVLLAKTTTVTWPTVCRREWVKLTPHVRQLTVEGADEGVLLSNGASKLQDGDVESVALRLIEFRRMLPHHSSGRQGGEIHSKLNFHIAKEDLSSMSLISGPILVVAQIEHVLLTAAV